MQNVSIYIDYKKSSLSITTSTKLRQGNDFTPVCQSFRSWGCGRPPPGRQPPPRADTTPRQTPPPWAGTPCCDTANKRVVRILLECILILTVIRSSEKLWRRFLKFLDVSFSGLSSLFKNKECHFWSCFQNKQSDSNTIPNKIAIAKKLIHRRSLSRHKSL